MAIRGRGICTGCGKEADVNVIDDITILCDECIDMLNYIKCDNCNEYWLLSDMIFYHLKDKRILCDQCAHWLIEDKKISDEDIDRIENHTRFK